MSRYFHKTRYTSKVINRTHLKKSIVLFRLKGSNLNINGIDLNLQDFNMSKYEFDANDDAIVTVVQDQINNYHLHWENVPIYNDYSLCNIYKSDNYLLINNDELEALPSVITQKDMHEEDILWCVYDYWKAHQFTHELANNDKQGCDIFKYHADRVSESLWHTQIDADYFKFYTDDRYYFYKNIFNTRGYSYKTTEVNDAIFREFFDIAI